MSNDNTNDPRNLIDMIPVKSRTARNSYKDDKISVYTTEHNGETFLNLHTDNGKYQLNENATLVLLDAVDSAADIGHAAHLDRSEPF